MKIANVLGATEAVATAVWAGSSTGFAFLSPITFRAVEDKEVFSGITERSLARLAGVAFVAGALAGACALAQRRPLRAALGAAALALVAYQQRAIVPAMRGVERGTEPYHELHRRSTRVYGAALLLGYAELAAAAAG